MSCHPTHVEGPPAPNVSEEERERSWEEFRKDDRVDPRAIRRQHRFKPGHEPDYADPASGWKYLEVKFEGEPADPDQRDQLHGGPPSGLNCERCGEETRVVGSMSVWEQYQQTGVEVVNLPNISEQRKKELQQQRIVVLKCPHCLKTYQWDEELLPGKVHRT